MRTDSVDLICSVAELARLFEESDSLQTFLQRVVETVAQHMHAPVCSVYLYTPEKEELVLHATKGLNQDSVGKVRLRLGEGITGLALKELRPVCESTGAANPSFRFFPGIGEEQYKAFLAVPILRGLSRIGALVVQHPQSDYFTPSDVKALTAIAAQLASTIENARLLMVVRSDDDTPPARPESPLPEGSFLKGTPASSGIAIGHALVLAGDQSLLASMATDGDTPPLSITDFDRAVERAETQLEELQVQLQEQLSDVAAPMIFSAHLLMLKDSQFTGGMRELIKAGVPPQKAVVQIVNRFTKLFSNSPVEAIREKTQDVRDLGHRLLRNLTATTDEPTDNSGLVVVTEDLPPSDILKLKAQHTAGLVLLDGSITAHVAILARSLELPLVIAKDPRLLKIATDTPLVVDANQGSIFVAPDETVLTHYRDLLATERHAQELAQPPREETWTRDHERMHLLATVNLCSDLRTAKKLHAEGVGLYRTEFPYIIRNEFPSEEELYRVYRRVVDEMGDRQVAFRTLDVGGDKILSYFPSIHTANPFLGLRALRFALEHRNVFRDQLRALLRAAEGRQLRVMFPMVTSLDDFREARALLEACRNELRNDNVPHAADIALGAMLEVPSVVEIIDELAQEADFFSIGTNDLIQYLLAVDRTDERLSAFYAPHHPAVLRVLRRIATSAGKHGVPVCICGELAADPKFLPVLVGLGIDHFSLPPKEIPAVQSRLETLSVEACKAFVNELLTASTLSRTEALLSTGPSLKAEG